MGADGSAPERGGAGERPWSPIARFADPERTAVRALAAWDARVFRRIAARESPGLDRVLPPLSRAADHSVLWMGLSAGLWLTGRRGRQAAGRGVASIAVASTLTNQVGKRLFGRTRPPLLEVPVARRLARVPTSASLPSGHSASAAAYAVAVTAVDPRLAAPVGALAAAVGYSRVYTGVHYPSDVLVGAGVGAAVGAVVSATVVAIDRRRRPVTTGPPQDSGAGELRSASVGSPPGDRPDRRPAARG